MFSKIQARTQHEDSMFILHTLMLTTCGCASAVTCTIAPDVHMKCYTNAREVAELILLVHRDYPSGRGSPEVRAEPQTSSNSDGWFLIALWD